MAIIITLSLNNCFSIAHTRSRSGGLFLFNYPLFYKFDLPQKFNLSNPNLTAALGGKHLEKKNLLVHQLTSLEGQEFIGFAKSASYNGGEFEGGSPTCARRTMSVDFQNRLVLSSTLTSDECVVVLQDLWTGIAAALKSDLAVESWRKGKPNLNSSCSSYFKVVLSAFDDGQTK